MATATKPELNVPVNFGGVSIGKATARISMKIERDESFSITRAEESFCGRRLIGKIQLGRKGDQDGQTTMWDDAMAIEGSFDVHRMGVNLEEFSIGATFSKSEIDLTLLGDFSNGSGRMIVNSIELIPEDVVEEHDGDGESLPGTYKVDGPWKKASLDDLFSGAILKNLKAAGLQTVGDLHDYQQPSKSGHVAQLADIKGVGTAAATKIEDRMIEFWRDNIAEGEDES